MIRKQKMLGILLLVTMVSLPAKAGWIGDFGRRLIEGAKNAAQNNVQNKINRSIDNAMDGKLGKQQKSTNSVKGKNEYQGDPERSISKSGSGGENIENIDSSGMLNLSVVRRRALPVKGVYQDVDFGIFKFKGERLYDVNLLIGEQMKEIDLYLLPGRYLICFAPRSYTTNMSVVGKHEGEGIFMGYGIKVERFVENNGLSKMNSKKGSTIYIIEASKNGAHLEMAMFNDEAKSGAIDFSIFSIPDSVK